MCTITAATLDGMLLFVMVRNTLYACVKQWVHVDLTSSGSLYLLLRPKS